MIQCKTNNNTIQSHWGHHIDTLIKRNMMSLCFNSLQLNKSINDKTSVEHLLNQP